MPEKMEVGCARPVGGPAEKNPEIIQEEALSINKEEVSMIKVGQKAPDFTAPAYFKGDFVSLKLSDYIGKWVFLCFYPGDFTFV